MRSTTALVLHSRAHPMQVIARRFLIDRDEAIDLATGEPVRLWAGARLSPGEQRARAALCDRLAGLRHPLINPPLDYGCERDGWFEAYALRPALHAPARQLPVLALHAIRFLAAEEIALTASMAERVIRPAIEGAGTIWRPLGVRLQPRAAAEHVRTAIDASRPPGVVRLTVQGPPGSGMTTIRLQLARVARLAGYVAVDRKVACGWTRAAEFIGGQHVCVLDADQQEDDRVPAALLRAAGAGSRRHLWLRFERRPSRAADVISVDRLGRSAMKAMLFVDERYGPRPDEIERAIDGADGRPGAFVDALAARRTPRRGLDYVHETSPEYAAASAGLVKRPARQGPVETGPAGPARLLRAFARGEGLAARHRRVPAERVLSRCAAALAARGLRDEAARALCALGDVRLEAGRVDLAVEAFARARELTDDERLVMRAVIGGGRAALERARFADAEAAFRTACIDRTCADAALGLAGTLWWQGRAEEALELIATWRSRCEAPGWRIEADALSVRCRRTMGDLASAQRGAAGTIVSADRLGDARVSAEAYFAAWTVQLDVGDLKASDELSRAALAHARRARLPLLVFRACAARIRTLPPAPAAAWRRRLERMASGLPPLRSAELLATAGSPDQETHEQVVRFARETGAAALLSRASPVTATDALEELLERVYGAPDEGAALEAVTAHVRGTLRASAVAVYSGSPLAAIAATGAAARSDSDLASRVIDGGQTVMAEYAVREAGEPVRYGGSTVGAIITRWAPGTIVPSTRARQQLRLAAAACAPLLRAWLDRPAGEPSPAAQHPDDLLGPGPLARAVRDAIRRAALAPYPVLIEGESGSGKELVARAIHTRSARRLRRFCAVNCAALTDDLVEAELFGHVRGAFTGALAERAGLFEEADGGTLFLDEVSELSPRAQAKLLRVLQEGEVRRVGENLPRRTDARVIGATNRPLAAEAAAGRFRADLRFRLDVIRVTLPPLRDRPDDVPWLAQRFWTEAAARVGTRATLAPDLIAALARYDWPGNVRELQNVIAALAVHAPRRGRVPPSALPPHIAGLAAQSATTFEDARVEFERRFVRAALARAAGQRGAAAADLGVTRQGLAKMMKRLGLGA